MRNGIHFISGLPRSGSTLLAAILRQNPRIHANMTNPLGSLFIALLRQMSQENETAVFIDDRRRRDVLSGLFNSYYHREQREQVIFDTNRLWCTKLPALVQLFPDSKVICCVRHVPWILDSIVQFDARLGTPGLHTVGKAVRPHERQTILPPDLFRRVEADSFWRDPAVNVRGVKIV